MFVRRTLAFVVLVGLGSQAGAQTVPWVIFDDPLSTAQCAVINANNAELVLIDSTRQLALVSTTDLILENAFVDDGGFVTFEDAPAGALAYATDGDGGRTLWWLSITGTVVTVNGFTGEPTLTDKTPNEFDDPSCDACDFWDNRVACLDEEPPPDGEPPPTVSVPLCGTNVVFPLGLTTTMLLTLSWVRRGRYGLARRE